MLRHLSGAQFFCGWGVVTFFIVAIGVRCFLWPAFLHFQTLRHSVFEEAELINDRIAMRKKVDKVAAEIRRLRAASHMISSEGVSSVTIGTQVNRLMNRLQRAKLDSVSVEREGGGSDNENVTLTLGFNGSLENVGIFLADVHTESEAGLALMSASLSRRGSPIAEHLSVRLVLSVRSISRGAPTCAQPRSS